MRIIFLISLALISSLIHLSETDASILTPARSYQIPLLPDSSTESTRMRSDTLSDMIPAGLYMQRWEQLMLSIWSIDKWSTLEVWIGEPNAFWDSNPLWKPQIQWLQRWKNTLSATRDGLVYLRYIWDAWTKKKYATVRRISGWSLSPIYEKWWSTPTRWNRELSYAKSPYVQIVSDRTYITVKRSSYEKMLETQTVDIPDTLTTLDTMIRWYDDLVGYTGSTGVNKRTPLRIHYREDDISTDPVWKDDVYMYATDHFIGMKAENIGDLLGKWRLRDAWSIWHETGHLYQQRDWTWWAITEVSVNIFSLMVQEKYGLPSRLDDIEEWSRSSRAYGALWNAEKQKDYNQESWTYRWESPNMVWVRLGLFDELRQKYGTTLYTQLWRSYREDPVDTDDDTEKIRIFIRRMSSIAGSDIRSIFSAWGLR